MSRTITVTSGKGGVGKTNIALNLAVSFAKAGKKVCLFDVDLGLANINILLGLYPEETIQEVIFQDRRPQDIMMHAAGIDILPGSSGIEEIANLDSGQLQRLIEMFSSLDDYDFVIFDTSAGIARNVLAFCLAASELVMVITPEPTSLTDAYALLKVMAANGFGGTVRTIINNCKDPEEAIEIYQKFKKTVNNYLAIQVQALGPIFQDSQVSEAVRRQKPFAELFPESIASRCLKKITERLLAEIGDATDKDDLASFWQQCLAFFSGPVKMPGDDWRKFPLATEEKAPDNNFPGTDEGSGLRLAEIETRADPLPDYRKGSEKEEHPVPVVPLAEGVWEMLIEGVMNISHELQMLRESIQQMQQSQSHKTTNKDTAKANSRIVLNLAAYVREKQGNPEEPQQDG